MFRRIQHVHLSASAVSYVWDRGSADQSRLPRFRFRPKEVPATDRLERMGVEVNEVTLGKTSVMPK